MKRKITILVLLAITLAVQPPPLSRGGTTAAQPDLVIVHTNDLHAHYRPFENRRGEICGGMARIATRIGELRREHGEKLIYVDTGDLFQGTPFYHFYRGSLGLEILERMGCRAMALGNHELDDGSLHLLRTALGVDIPLLCANLDYPDGAPLLPGTTEITVDGLKIGIIGLISSGLPEIVSECGRGELLVRSPAMALRDWLDEAAHRYDLQLVLSHCGLEEDRQLAQAAPELPLIIGGHSHSFLFDPEQIGNTLICQTGCFGYNLGILEGYRQRDGTWHFTERLEPVKEQWAADPEISKLIDDAAKLVDREMKVVLAELPEPFDALDKSRRPEPLGMLIAETYRQAVEADIGLQNVGGYRTYLTEGPLRRERLFELLPFDNKVVQIRFNGRQLMTLFDFLAAGHDTGRFAQLAGCSYTIDHGKAKRVMIGGDPLDPEAYYTLATVDFLYGGGDGFTFLAEGELITTLDDFPRELLERRFLQSPPPRPGDLPPNFQVVGQGASSPESSEY